MVAKIVVFVVRVIAIVCCGFSVAWREEMRVFGIMYIVSQSILVGAYSDSFASEFLRSRLADCEWSKGFDRFGVASSPNTHIVFLREFEKLARLDMAHEWDVEIIAS